MTLDSHKLERLEGEVASMLRQGMTLTEMVERLRGFGAWSRIRRETVWGIVCKLVRR